MYMYVYTYYSLHFINVSTQFGLPCSFLAYFSGLSPLALSLI